MKQVHNYEIGKRTGPEENNLIEFEPKEFCAIETALARRPDFIERIKNEQIAIGGVGTKSIIGETYRNLTEEHSKVTPELSAIYLNAAIEERRILEKQKPDELLTCDFRHTVSDHIKTLNSLIDFFENNQSSKPN